MITALNAPKIGYAVRGFSGAVHRVKAEAPAKGSSRSGGNRPRAFNFKREARRQRMNMMRQAAKRPQ